MALQQRVMLTGSQQCVSVNLLANNAFAPNGLYQCVSTHLLRWNASPPIWLPNNLWTPVGNMRAPWQWESIGFSSVHKLSQNLDFIQRAPYFCSHFHYSSLQNLHIPSNLHWPFGFCWPYDSPDELGWGSVYLHFWEKALFSQVTDRHA
jgi:hypothetical protein